MRSRNARWLAGAPRPTAHTLAHVPQQRWVGDLADQVVQQFCDEHPKRYRLAIVYGHLGEHDLLLVRTEADKHLLLAALNLVECVADVGSTTSS